MQFIFNLKHYIIYRLLFLNFIFIMFTVPYPTQNNSISQQHPNELQLLLKTNKILIQNKKHIYETKINTYNKQIDKLNSLLNIDKSKRNQQIQSDDIKRYNLEYQGEDEQQQQNQQQIESRQKEEQQSLRTKLLSFQLKRKQAMDKLKAIQKIEKDIKCIKPMGNQNINTNHKPPQQSIELEQSIKSQPLFVKKLSGTNKILQSIQNVKQSNQCKPLKFRVGKQRNLFSQTTKISMKNVFESHLNYDQNQWRIKQKQNKKELSISQIDTQVQKNNWFLSHGQKIKNQLQNIGDLNIQQKNKSKDKSLHKNKYTNDCKNPNKYILIENGDQKIDSREQICLWTEPENITQFSHNKTNVSKSKSKQKKQPFKKLNNKKGEKYLDDKKYENPYILFEQIGCIISIILKIEGHNYSNFVTDNQIHSINQAYQKLKQIHQYIQHTNLTLNSLKNKTSYYEQKQRAQKQLRAQDKKQQNYLKNLIARLKQQQTQMSAQLMKIQQQCDQYCNQISIRQHEYEKIGKQIQEIQNYKKQTEKNMDDVIRSYQKNLQDIQKQMSDIYQAMCLTQRQPTRNPTLAKQKYAKPSKTTKSSISNPLQKTCQKICQMCQYIRTTAQNQKLAILQNKQLLLSLQYQVGLLKSQQSRLQIKSTELLQKIQKNCIIIQQRDKDINKLNKQKQSVSKQVQNINSQMEQYENLMIIKKKNYQQLDEKYNNLKTKKNKIQKNLKNIENQIQDRQQKLSKIQESIERRQRHLQDTNQRITCNLHTKDNLIQECQQMEQKISSLTLAHKSLEQQFQNKQQSLNKINKKLSQFDLQLQKKTVLSNQYQQDIKQLQNKIIHLERQKSMKQQHFQKVIFQIQQRQQELRIIKQKLKQAKDCIQKEQVFINMQEMSLQEIQASLNKGNQEISKLKQLKQQLEKAMRAILQKKEQCMSFLSEKYLLLQSLQESSNELSHQIANIQQNLHTKNLKLTELSQNKKQLEQEKQHLTQQIAQKTEILSSIMQQLQQNRDEEQNLKQRLRTYKQLGNKILIQIGLQLYSEQANIENIKMNQLVPAEIKQQIEVILQQLSEVSKIKAKYQKQKQQNRKLKLDNERIKKLYELEMQANQNN